MLVYRSVALNENRNKREKLTINQTEWSIFGFLHIHSNYSTFQNNQIITLISFCYFVFDYPRYLERLTLSATTETPNRPNILLVRHCFLLLFIDLMMGFHSTVIDRFRLNNTNAIKRIKRLTLPKLYIYIYSYKVSSK